MKMEKLDRGRVQLLLRISATRLRVLRLLTDEAVRLLRIHRVEVALVPHVLRRLPATLLPLQPLLDDVAPVLPAPGLPVLGIPLRVRHQVPPPTAQYYLKNGRGRKIRISWGQLTRNSGEKRLLKFSSVFKVRRFSPN